MSYIDRTEARDDALEDAQYEDHRTEHDSLQSGPVEDCYWCWAEVAEAQDHEEEDREWYPV